MSELRFPDETGGGLAGMPPSDLTPRERRAGSVTLREGAAAPGGGAAGLESAVDPANQSLADALRIMLRFLQVGMVALAVLYVLSGLEKVNEGERGIRMLFGKRVESNLEPGFHWSAPYPIGQLVKVKQGYSDMDISKDFWIDVPAGQESQAIEKLQGTPSLKPDQNGSGSVITSDGNLAHTKWRVSFQRRDVSKFYERVPEEVEKDLVRAEVKRAVVQTVAEVPLNDLLQQTSVQGASVPKRAQLIAQEALDRLGTGIEIKVLTMDPPIPPLYAKDSFNKASAATAEANKNIQEALTYRGEKLNAAAGDAAKYIIYYIDQYEAALARKDANADALVATIDAIMVGRDAVEVLALGEDGKPEREESGQLTGHKISLKGAAKGNVSAILSDASLYRTGVRSKAQTTLARYEAKLAQFKVNPAVMMQREWTEAMRSFMSRDTFEWMLVPQGTSTLELLLNSDPDIEKETQAAIKRAQREATEREHEREQRLKGRETVTGGLGVRE